MKLLGTLLIFLAAGTSAFAVAAPVPEIDGSTAVSGMVLIAGALVVLRSRRKK